MKLVRTYGRGAQAAKALIETIEQRSAANTAKVEGVVAKILAGVKRAGEAGLRRYAEKFDGLPAGAPLLVSRQEMKVAWEDTAPELRAAMEVARENIRAFAEAQKPSEWMTSPADGIKTGQVVRP